MIENIIWSPGLFWLFLPILEVIFIGSSLHLIFTSSNVFSSFSRTVPSAPTTIGITLTFRFWVYYPKWFLRDRFWFVRVLFIYMAICTIPSGSSFLHRHACSWKLYGTYYDWLVPTTLIDTWNILNLIHYDSLIRVFNISVTRWFFTGVGVTVSLLKSPGLFSVIWPFSIMLSFRWSPPVRQLPSAPVPLVIL